MTSFPFRIGPGYLGRAFVFLLLLGFSGCGDLAPTLMVPDPPVQSPPIPVAVEFSGPGPVDTSTLAQDFAPLRRGREWAYRRVRKTGPHLQSSYPGSETRTVVRIRVDSIFQVGGAWRSHCTVRDSGEYIGPVGAAPYAIDTVEIDTMFTFIAQDDGLSLSGNPHSLPFFYKHRHPVADTSVKTWTLNYPAGPYEGDGVGVRETGSNGVRRLIRFQDATGYSGGGATYYTSTESWYEEEVGLVRSRTLGSSTEELELIGWTLEGPPRPGWLFGIGGVSLPASAP